MIIIETAKRKFFYKGKIEIMAMETFILVQAEWRDGEWRGHTYDAFYPKDIISITGVDE